MTGRHGRVAGLIASLMMLVVVLVGCGPASTTPPPSLSPAPTLRVEPGQLKPVAIRIPSIDVDSKGHNFVPLGIQGRNGVPVETETGALEVPDVHQPLTPGWWANGVPPGVVGTSVIVAHVDGDHQKGLFYNLHSVKPGAKVEVDRSDGMTIVFDVYRVTKVDKEQFPSQQFWGATPQAELHLATCGGRYSPKDHRYLDNWLVYAKFDQVKP